MNIHSFFYFLGINVKLAGAEDNLMHNKFCLVDVLKNELNENSIIGIPPILINGSLNWTRSVSCQLLWSSTLNEIFLVKIFSFEIGFCSTLWKCDVYCRHKCTRRLQGHIWFYVEQIFVFNLWKVYPILKCATEKRLIGDCYCNVRTNQQIVLLRNYK